MTNVNPTIPLIKADGVKKYFTVKSSAFMDKRRYLKAVDGIDLRIHVGETLGLVGESGCGKSTLGRTILKLHSVTDGDLWFGDKRYSHYNARSMRDLRKQMQMIFQDPYAALNPRMTIFESVKAPLDVFRLYDKAERRERGWRASSSMWASGGSTSTSCPTKCPAASASGWSSPGR